jgi:hypothetical protein
MKDSEYTQPLDVEQLDVGHFTDRMHVGIKTFVTLNHSLSMIFVIARLVM